jgi:hypothetical protein
MSAPKSHGPCIVSATAVGPAPHLPCPSASSVAVGNCRIGPTPQITCPGLAGERKSDSWMSPSPNTSPNPGASSGWSTRGTIVREIRFQSGVSRNGMTGWTWRTYWRSLPGPTPELRSCSNGTAMRSATGFWLFWASSASSWARPSPGRHATTSRSTTPTPRLVARDDRPLAWRLSRIGNIALVTIASAGDAFIVRGSGGTCVEKWRSSVLEGKRRGRVHPCVHDSPFPRDPEAIDTSPSPWSGAERNFPVLEPLRAVCGVGAALRGSGTENLRDYPPPLGRNFGPTGEGFCLHTARIRSDAATSIGVCSL